MEKENETKTLTPVQLDTIRRHERVKKEFEAMRSELPDLAFSRICELVIREHEANLPDGVKTITGIRKIIKKYNLLDNEQHITTPKNLVDD